MINFDPESVVVKAESYFYSSLEICPQVVFRETMGIQKHKEGNSTFLAISKDILNPGSLFYKYLMIEKSREIFGLINPLFRDSTLKYKNGNLVGVNHFNTRLLLAFFEVQMSLGFSGPLYEKHKTSLENIIRGKQEHLSTNYYHPIAHEDNAGIHYVLNKDGKGGYDSKDWDNFNKYFESSIKAAFRISPVDFGETQEGIERKMQEFTDLVSNPYKETGFINIPPIRHLGILINEVLYLKGSKNSCIINNPVTAKPMKYIPLVDCLLDMPYKKGSIIVFQSTCGDK